MTQRYHKAARDGLLDILRETTRKDCNSGDEDGMTPTLWAAFEGNLEALSLLVGRGGDPNKCDHYGNSALHLASARGHLDCVTFLVNFGVNIYSLDIDMHTPQELAAMNNCGEILRYLDGISAKQEQDNPKKVKAFQERAQKDAQKLLKNFKKIQKKAEKISSKEEKELQRQIQKMEIAGSADGLDSGSTHHRVAGEIDSGTLSSTTTSSSAPKFSEMVMGSSSTSSSLGSNKTGTVRGKIISKVMRRSSQDQGRSDSGFTVRGKKQSGLRRDSEILFANKITEEPVTLDESDSLNSGSNNGNPGMLFQKQIPRHKSISAAGMTGGASMFNRDGFGSMAFRNSMSASLFSFQNEEGNSGSIGSAGSLAESDEDQEASTTEASAEFAPIAVFLAGLGMTDFIKIFAREKIDLNSLTLLEENDLRDMGLPTGPRKKIMKAIEERRSDMNDTNGIEDSHL